MTTDWSEELLEVYRRYRIEDQAAYYERRAGEYERSRRWTVRVSAVLLVLAAMFGAVGAADADRRALWAFVAAGLAALATAINTFESAFAFERLSRQYSETCAALALAEVSGPRAGDSSDALDGGDQAVHEFVTEIERILRSEVDTWAQRGVVPPAGGEPAAPPPH